MPNSFGHAKSNKSRSIRPGFPVSKPRVHSAFQTPMRLLWACLCPMLLVALLSGCRQTPAPASSNAQVAPIPIEIYLADATPSPTPYLDSPDPEGNFTPAPDMTFDQSGNIWFSDTLKAQFAARTFTFARPPRVLIYHTHAGESFREPDATPAGAATPFPASASPAPAGGSSELKIASSAPPSASPAPANSTPTPTASSSNARSDDPAKTVVHLGILLAQALTDRGFVVFHDGTNVEAPELSSAYERSKKIVDAYEDIDIYIDLHRNAADPVKSRDDIVMIDGKRTARMFFVVGTGINAETNENALPNWGSNYTFALSLYEQLAAINPRLVKENRVKQGFYNQQNGLCLLAEIGHNANLLTDAENTIPLFADALAKVCKW